MEEQILARVTEVAIEQARVAAELKAHAEKDDVRFQGIAEKLDGITRASLDIASDVKSLLLARSFAQGVRWSAMKAATLISLGVSAIWALVVWLVPVLMKTK